MATGVALEGTPGTASCVTTPLPSSSSSQKSRVALKARENLLLLAGLSQEAAATCLVRGSALCQLLTGHLCDLYSTVPAGTDPADVLTMDRASWRCGDTGLGVTGATQEVSQPHVLHPMQVTGGWSRGQGFPREREPG